MLKTTKGKTKGIFMQLEACRPRYCFLILSRWLAGKKMKKKFATCCQLNGDFHGIWLILYLIDQTKGEYWLYSYLLLHITGTMWASAHTLTCVLDDVINLAIALTDFLCFVASFIEEIIPLYIVLFFLWD